MHYYLHLLLISPWARGRKAVETRSNQEPKISVISSGLCAKSERISQLFKAVPYLLAYNNSGIARVAEWIY